MSETGKDEGQPPNREPVFTKGAWKRFIILAICLGGPYLFKEQIFEALETISNQIKLPSAIAGPRFKVEYGYFMVPALDCPGGRCQQSQTQRLKVQSLNKEPVATNDATINGQTECMTNFFGLFGLKGITMKYGEVRYVLTTCEPAEFRILTDKGESTYTFNSRPRSHDGG